MTPDFVNGAFEIVGALFNSINVYRIMRDKSVTGVSWIPTAFFTAWGVWNLYYYPHLGQWLSFFGGIAQIAVNGVWVYLALHYSKGKQ